MLDKLEYRIAKQLADHHFYPFAEHNYLNIFNAFSYFPINFKDIGINEEGKTVTFLALVVYYCFKNKKNNFNETYKAVLSELKTIAQPHFPQDMDHVYGEAAGYAQEKCFGGRTPLLIPDVIFDFITPLGRP